MDRLRENGKRITLLFSLGQEVAVKRLSGEEQGLAARYLFRQKNGKIDAVYLGRTTSRIARSGGH